MTLQPKTTQVFGVGDILLSRSDSDTSTDRNNIPLQSQLAVPFSSTQGIGLSSKAAIFSDYIYLWAGTYLTAKRILQAIMSEKPTNMSRFREICSDVHSSVAREFPNQDMRCEAILYCNHADRYIWGGGWPNPQTHYHWKDYWHLSAGTGKSDFHLYFESSYVPIETPGMRSLAAVAQMTLKELTDRGHSWDVYGGGYEFFVPIEGGGFERLPHVTSEISTIDHLNVRKLGWFQLTRIVQCLPSEFGSIFITGIFPSIDAKMPAKYSVFYAPDFAKSIDNEKQEIQLSKLKWEPSLSINIQIDNGSAMFFGPDSVAHLKYENQQPVLILDPERQKGLHEYFMELHGAKREPNLDGRYDIIICAVCENIVKEANYIPLGNSAEYVCDDCAKI